MKIDKTKIIDGIRLIKVRDLMRSLEQLHVTRGSIERRVGKDITDALLKEGLIALSDHEGYHVRTEAGTRLANTRFIKRFDRTKADTLVADLIRRAHAINANDDLLYRVKGFARSVATSPTRRTWAMSTCSSGWSSSASAVTTARRRLTPTGRGSMLLVAAPAVSLTFWALATARSGYCSRRGRHFWRCMISASFRHSAATAA